MDFNKTSLQGQLHSSGPKWIKGYVLERLRRKYTIPGQYTALIIRVRPVTVNSYWLGTRKIKMFSLMKFAKTKFCLIE